MFCKTDSDDTYRPRHAEYGVVRAVGVDIGGPASHMVAQDSVTTPLPAFYTLQQQQQSQQPQFRPLVLKRSFSI